MPNVYDVGDMVRIQATFAASSGLADPSQVWFLMLNGLGTPATHTYGVTPSQIFRSGAGGYYIDISVASAEGIWRYRWEGTGNNVQVAEETQFQVRDSFKL